MKESQCDFCSKVVVTWIDGKTVHGPWANMCLQCYKVYGIGLGIGRGQMYDKGVQVAGGSRTGK